MNQLLKVRVTRGGAEKAVMKTFLRMRFEQAWSRDNASIGSVLSQTSFDNRTAEIRR